MIELTETNDRERAILVGLDLGKDRDFMVSMEELKALTEACGMQVLMTVTQALASPVAATYIGTGKLHELRMLCDEEEADLVVFEDALSPAQMKNISNFLEIPVYDRTGLILEIFSRRAKSREARMQVEMAKLQYMLPRLVGMRASLGRQGGTGGSMSNKGAGETQLELDRRRIEKRISELRHDLELVEHDRDVQRKQRQKGNTPTVALVGYTNAGKSTVMNCLLRQFGSEEEKMVYSEDMLFATLDTTIRRICPGDNKDFILSDTVGFVSRLPHSLVKAFRSTLEEVRQADLLLQVVDVSDPFKNEQIKVTAETLKELGADDIPRILVLNKADRIFENGNFPEAGEGKVYLSAADGRGIPALIEMIQNEVYGGNVTADFLIPYADGKAVHELNENASVLSLSYEAEGVKLRADCPQYLFGKYEKYTVH